MRVLDVIALIEDVPEHGLRRGQVGTIVEGWQEGIYEIEFAGTDGVAYAMVSLSAQQLMPLHWEPDTRQTA